MYICSNIRNMFFLSFMLREMNKPKMRCLAHGMLKLINEILYKA